MAHTTSRYDLYLRISQNLNGIERRDLRNYVECISLLPAIDLEHMDLHAIFLKLEHRGKLKEGDLSLLVDLMTKINRNDFAEEAKQIAAQERKALELQSKYDSSDEELPESPAKRPQPLRQSAKDTSTTDVSRYFNKVIKRVSHNWDGLARELGFLQNEIEKLRSDNPDQERRCRAMLERWKNKYGRAATLRVLQDALISINEREPAQELAEDVPKPEKKKEDELEARKEALAYEGDGKIDVKVEPCDAAAKEKIIEEKWPYRMDSKPRGYALILNNSYFTTMSRRLGSDIDLSNITALLEGLSFETHILQDLRAQEIKDRVLEFSKQKEHQEVDCCVVVMMSRGDLDQAIIFGTDEKPVQLYDIFAMFDDKNCPRLMGKPKLFFIQVCYGAKVDDQEDSSAPEVELKNWMGSHAIIQNISDVFCAYATQFGYKSFRNRENGSWFIQAITKVFMKNAKNTCLAEMMTMVNEDVSKRKARYLQNPAKLGSKEVSVSTLRKHLYFFPEGSNMSGYSRVPIEIQLRGPHMQKLYSDACRKGTGRVHNLRALVVGKYESGKTCLVKRLTGEKALEDEQITDGIEISPSVSTKTWRKATEEPDEFKETMADNLAKEAERTGSGTKALSPTEKTGTEESESNTVTEPIDMKEEAEKQGEQMQQEQPSEEAETLTQTKEIPKRESEDEKRGEEESVSRDEPSSNQAIPDEILMETKWRLTGGVTEEQLGTAENPRISFWDFGGQAAYYGSHQCFFTYRGIYILVMSLLHKLSDPVPDLDYKASADNLTTGREYLDHWLNSVHTHTLVHGRELTPVILVLTHKDQVNKAYIKMYMEEIRNHIEEIAAGKHIKPKIFVINNLSDDDSDIDELREYLREIAKDLWFMGEEVPMTWLHLKSKLMDKRKEDDPFCCFQDVVDLARSVDITDESEVADILTFLHDLGDIIFIDEPVLRDNVGLRPQVMIDVFKTIITIPQYQQGRNTNEKIEAMWKRLEDQGILSEELLTIIWTEADKKLPFLLRKKPFLKRLMEKYYLICNATPISAFDDEMKKSDQEEIYFVPSLLAAKPDDNTLYPRHMARFRCPLYVEFESRSLPSGMFYRLQAICVRRFGFQESRVYAGCARFPTDDVKQNFVVTKEKHYLKVELLSTDGEVPVFTQGLPVRKFLSSCLFEIKEKWILSIQYDWCFREDQYGDEPAFRPLSADTGQETTTKSCRLPEDFVEVWMGGSCDQRTPCTENSGGDGPVMTQPTLRAEDINPMRTIGPVLECMEAYKGLTLGQCDLIRRQPTYVSRFKKLVAMVKNNGDTSRRSLGASVEICRPERASSFPREIRGNEIVVLHVGDYNDKLVQPLLLQAGKSSCRYGVSIREDVIASGDFITKKVLDHLLNPNVGMVVPIITPQALHETYWSTLGYEFCVQNKDLVFPVFVYPAGGKERLREVLGKRCALILDMAPAEVSMTEESLPSTKISLISAEILNKASTSVVRNTYKISAEGCTLEEDGVTIFFPKGCVREERALSLEVETLPTNDTLTTRFSAVTSMLTVHQGEEKGFLVPVTVTLPWTWKSAGNLGRTVLMRRSDGGQWSSLTTEIQETTETVTFTTDHFCRTVVAKTRDDDAGSSISTDTTGEQDESAIQKATDGMEIVVAAYSEDKVHLIINPNQATTDERSIHLLCLRKGDKVTDFFRAPNLQIPPPFELQVVMHQKERIRAWFGDDEDVIADQRDIPKPDGILFVYPPANCNRFSVRLKLRDAQTTAGKFDGTVYFQLLSEAGEPVSDPRRRINPAHVHFLPQQGSGKKSRKRKGNQYSGRGKKAKKAVPNKSDSSEEELPDSPAKRLKLPQPPRQSAMDTSKSDVSIYFDKVVKRVSRNWDELAEKLGFTENDIENLRSDKPDQARRCKAMLRKWKNKYATGATLHVLQDALISIEQGDTAQELEGGLGGAGPSHAGYDEGPSGGSTADNPKPRNQKKKKKEETEPKAREEPLADEGDGKIDVKVEPCGEDFWEKIMDEEDPYRMDRKPRGYALILNNTTFTTLPYRKGGAVDMSNITALLEGLSFETHILNEKTSTEIEDEVLAFSQRKQHKRMDCCVVVLMSHGDAGVIFGTDDKPVKLDDIFAKFDNESCPRLMDKPKLFFIQACRGPKVNKDEADSSASDVKVDLKSEMRSLLHLPADESDGPGAQSTRTDMLCGYATQLGYKSFRNRENGSWFIQDITKVFMEHAKEGSLREMMKIVKEDVSKRTARCNNPAEDGGKEVAEFDHTLQKPLYFFPGVE